MNLCHNKSDFGVKYLWSFYATIRGKSPYDWIGGTIKCLTARAIKLLLQDKCVHFAQRKSRYISQNRTRKLCAQNSVKDMRTQELCQEPQLPSLCSTLQKPHRCKEFPVTQIMPLSLTWSFENPQMSRVVNVRGLSSYSSKVIFLAKQLCTKNKHHLHL